MHELVAGSMSPADMVALGRRIEALERPEAARRRTATQARNAGDSSSGKFPELESKGDTRDKVGDALGVSGRTYEKAKQVVEAASVVVCVTDAMGCAAG